MPSISLNFPQPRNATGRYLELPLEDVCLGAEVLDGGLEQLRGRGPRVHGLDLDLHVVDQRVRHAVPGEPHVRVAQQLPVCQRRRR